MIVSKFSVSVFSADREGARDSLSTMRSSVEESPNATKCEVSPSVVSFPSECRT